MARSELPRFDRDFDDFPPFDPVSYETWKAAAEETLQGGAFDARLVTKTLEDIAVLPLYARSDDAALADPGEPGARPWTRRARALDGELGWRIRQEIGEANPMDAAAAIRHDRNRDVDAFWLRLDRSLREGVPHVADPDGVLLADAGDLDAILEALGPGSSVVVDAGIAAPAVLAACLERGESRVDVPADPVGDLLATGRDPRKLDERLRLVLEAAHAPEAKGLRSIGVRADRIHRAGGTAVEELAWATSLAVEYLRRSAKAGATVEEAAASLLFTFDVGRDLFMEIAKFRAARRLWGRALEAAGAANAMDTHRVHAFTSPRSKTRRDPWVNFLRATVETFAAAVGGADSITALPYDCRWHEPDGFSRRIAANTQWILQREVGLHRIVDPAGGSNYVESLTDELARDAWKLFQEIEAGGGAARAAADGSMAARVRASRSRRQRLLATRRMPLTGVSTYPNLGEDLPRRPPRDVDAAVARVERAAQRFPAEGSFADVREAVRSGASFIARDAESEPAAEPLAASFEDDDFEPFRAASDAWAASHGTRPRVFLANVGPIPRHKARATFAAGTFGAGGIEPVENEGFSSPNEAAAAFRESGARIAVVCGHDDDYSEAVPAWAWELREAGAQLVYVAGRPGSQEEAWREAGVDDFIFLGADVVATLRGVHEVLGVGA